MPYQRWSTDRVDPPEGGLCVIAGRYQLLEFIGEGGMGVVWRGFDIDLEEEVAIKFLREDLAGDDRRRACFRREVKLARQVTHPNVARVFEFGRDHGMYFLTMEFVAGESLQTTLLRHGSLSPQQVYRHALGLCRGLAAAHVAGIVHGDIKPGNILLAPRRGAVLTDFGIARAVSEVLRNGEDIGGTPLYMAPEQILGEALALQSDIYAAGLVLFEALTGELPWGNCDETELLLAKCGPEPDLRSVAPGLPDAWSRLIASCLRTDPAERPSDGRALLARLRKVDGTREDTMSANITDVAARCGKLPTPAAPVARTGAVATRVPAHIGDPPVMARGSAPRDGEVAAPVTDTALAGGPLRRLSRSRTARGGLWRLPDPVTQVHVVGARRRPAVAPAAPSCAPQHVVSEQDPARLPEPGRRLTIDFARDPTEVQLWMIGAGLLGVLRRGDTFRRVDGSFAVAVLPAVHHSLQVHG